MDIPLPILGVLALILLIGGAVYLFGLTKKWGILVPYCAMFLFGSMSLPLTWDDRVNPTVWLPIQQNRSTLYLISGIAALGMVFAQASHLRGKRQSISVWLLVGAGLYAAMLRFVHDGASEGASSVVFAMCTLLPLALLPSLVIREIDDFKLVLRAMVVVNIVWAGMVLVQIGVNPTFVTLGNQFRFVGIYANPQHAGVLMAFWCVIVLWLTLNDDRKYRLIYLALLGLNGAFLLWTGSRTGLGMTLIGVSAVLYTKAGRAILMLPVVAIITYVGLKVIVNVLGIDFGIERLASTDNTRDYAWWKLLKTGMENPLIGVGTLESEKSENSWLFGFAAFGIVMLSTLLLLTFVAVIESLKGLRARFSMSPHYRPMMDLVLGVVAMYFAGAVLEGYMISRVSATLCIYPVIAGAGALLRQSVSAQQPLYDDNYEYDSVAESYGDETLGYGDDPNAPVY